jgi:hypothetical protein
MIHESPLGVGLPVLRTVPKQENKKADVAERPEAFDHVGLLFNEPPGRQSRVALYLVIRRTQIPCSKEPRQALRRPPARHEYTMRLGQSKQACQTGVVSPRRKL